MTSFTFKKPQLLMDSGRNSMAYFSPDSTLTHKPLNQKHMTLYKPSRRNISHLSNLRNSFGGLNTLNPLNTHTSMS